MNTISEIQMNAYHLKPSSLCMHFTELVCSAFVGPHVLRAGHRLRSNVGRVDGRRQELRRLAHHHRWRHFRWLNQNKYVVGSIPYNVPTYQSYAV